jgi:GT2 family glycosyltransferase
MNDPDVSVIVVNYNAGPMLAACLRAVTRSKASLELIVVDNASSDDSLSATDMPARVEVIRHQENLGFARAVNAGFARATGHMLLILNPDCIVFPGAIDRLLATLDASPEAGIAGGLVVNIDGSEQRGCRRHEPTPRRILRRMLSPMLRPFGMRHNGIDQTDSALPEVPITVDAVSGAFLLIRRQVMRELNGMDGDYFLHFEDLDLCRRTRDAGYDILFEPHALAVHLKSASGGSDPMVVERHKHDGLLRYLGKFHSSRSMVNAMSLVRIASRMHLVVSALGPRTQGASNHPLTDEPDRRDVLAGIESLLGLNASEWMVLTGGTSPVGEYLLADRTRTGPVLAVTRGPRAGHIDHRIWWVRPEFTRIAANAGLNDIAAWVHIAPVWLISDYEESLLRLKPRRLVAVSSSSVVTKRDSRAHGDRRTVEKLQFGEREAQRIAAQCGAAITLFRPSMIYGNRHNQNIAFIARFITLLGVFPIVGHGRGKRQPVHAEDVAKSCLDVLDNEATFGRMYDLAGAEVIEFKEMITRVFASKSRKPRFVHLPGGILRTGVALASRLPGLRFLTPAMVDRLDQDLVFDISPARKDFAYTPRQFEP